MGRRPELKSDEFLESTPKVIEIQRCEHSTFPIQGYTYWDFESMAKIESKRLKKENFYEYIIAFDGCIKGTTEDVVDAFVEQFLCETDDEEEE